ncbi:MAG: hypothetical protein ABH840_04115 [Nanoarchaeota archaeon]
MVREDISAVLWGIASVGIGIISLFTEEYRALIISLFAVFMVAYFLSMYIKRIEEHETKIKELKRNMEMDEKLLNTLKDIVILNKVSKIK